MKKIIALGNSLTAIKTIEALKTFGEDVEAIIISQENTFPYYRNLLSSLPVRRIPQNKIFYRPSAEYQDEKINFLFDKKVERINFKRGRLTLGDKEQVDYDYLLLSDLVLAPFFGMKGANKTGLFNLKRLGDMTILMKLLPLVETIVVQSDNLAGLQMALGFCEAHKEVILVTSGKNVLNGLLAEADTMAIETRAQEMGLRIMTQSQITEFLGDSQVKAIRLQNGKVYGCQAVLTDSDFPDLRLFKDTDLKCDQRVSVSREGQTNFENVFALDAVCDTIKINDWDVAQNYAMASQEQGNIIAAKIVGKEYLAPATELIWEIPLKGEVMILITFSVGTQVSGSQLFQVKSEQTVVVP